ncbi:DUF3060 domain-containing protein [Mycobacterium interjectum]|uniref:DUF3060 domain-containing protein n=1 Tax=Mycobacterium interjectum TaxID=33895 RepID=UPI00082AA44C|nr:DUF3060 domain-containing protein [Mycobacterium interjectum]MCV7089621.1 DUF3060 domain-containing protein [Mycobacterium interjectum]
MRNAEDPEQYIRDLERGVGQTPGTTPRPFGTSSGPRFETSNGGQFGGAAPGDISRRRISGVARLAKTAQGRLLLAAAVAPLIAIGCYVATHHNKDTVHGNLIMINGGAKDTIDCNNGSLKLDGDNNTYTVTGNCRRLEVFGSANKVTVDSADTISVIGDDNAVIYHSGAPTINKTGNNDIVAQRR